MMKISDGIFCDLRHGVKLEVYSEPGKLNIQIVGDFLAKAMEHFKHHRDALKTDRYIGAPFCLTFRTGRGRKAERLATLQVTCPEVLTAALWTDAVISAYTTVNTVEQMAEKIGVWKEAVAKEGQSQFLRDVVGMFEERGGDLRAMQAMLKHRLARDLEQGYYKPGEITDVLAVGKARDSNQKA